MQRLDDDGAVVEEYCSSAMAARKLGLASGSKVSAVCNGGQRSTHGYLFRHKLEHHRSGTSLKAVVQIDENGNHVAAVIGS